MDNPLCVLCDAQVMGNHYNGVSYGVQLIKQL